MKVAKGRKRREKKCGMRYKGRKGVKKESRAKGVKRVNAVNGVKRINTVTRIM